MIRELQGPVLLCGDLNLPDISWEQHSAPAGVQQQVVEAVQDKFWTQVVDFPTHRGGNLLDVGLASRQGLVSRVESPGHLSSADHLMLKFTIMGPKRDEATTELVPDWTKADFEAMEEKMGDITWDFLLKDKSGPEQWAIFKEKLDEVIEENVPKKVRRKSSRPLWMRRNVLRMIRKKRRLWKQYTTSKDYKQFEAYKKVQSEVKKAVRKARKVFEKKLSKNAKKNSKMFWSYMKEKTSNRISVGPLVGDGEVISDDREMCEVLNKQYCSVFTREDMANFPKAEKNFFYSEDHELRDIMFTKEKVKTKLNKLKPSSAPGPDKIWPKVLNKLASTLSIPLATIFNSCMEEGSVPPDWKLANVTPIFKRGSKGDPANYRPVSLTSVCCKVMESITRDSIVDHLTKYQLIRSTQHGFVNARSTQSNLLEYMEKLSKLVDEGHNVDVVYCDFSKGFDVVPHKRLLAKCEGLGIRGKVLRWIEEWLTGRKQRVVLNGAASDWGDVISSVVQGSCLGPCLFVIFINDIDLAIDALGFIIKFADDSKAGRVVDSQEDREAFQQMLDRLESWSQEWQLLFNRGKCKIMHFGKNNPRMGYTMGGQALESSRQEKDLGVLIEDNLKPSAQCAKAASKANQVLGQLLRGCTWRDPANLTSLYKVYVRPHLEYAQASWAPWTQADIQTLEKVQQRFTKQVTGMGSLPYEERLNRLGLTTLQARRERGDMVETYKILNGMVEVDPNVWFTPLETRGGATSTRATCGYQNLARRESRQENRRNQFSIRVVPKWNSLPDAVKSQNTLNSFKNAYDNYIQS